MGKKGKHSKEKENKLRIKNKILKIGLPRYVVIALTIIIYSYSTQNKEEVNEQAEEQEEEESVETASVEE